MLYRKELQEKDKILQNLVTNKHIDIEKEYEKHDEDETNTYVTDMDALQTLYRSEIDEWKQQKALLVQENEELKDEINDIRNQLEIYKKNWQIIENGDNEVQKAFAIKTKEYANAANEIIIMNRKNANLQELLNKENNRSYECQKQIIKTENDLKRILTDTNKYNKTLLSEISVLQSNLSNSVSLTIHNELKEKYQELNIRFHTLLETRMAYFDYSEMSRLETEIEIIMQEKYQLIENLQKLNDQENDDNLQQKLKEIEAKELIERQRADQITRLHEILQDQLAKCENNVKQLSLSNSELQTKLTEMHKKLSKEIASHEITEADINHIKELQTKNTQLVIENEDLKKNLQISQEEAHLQYSLNSLQTLELDSLRHHILDLQAASEDKATISRLAFELTNIKISEMELHTQKTQLENELSSAQQEFESSKKKCEEMRTYIQDYRKQCDNRCR